MIKVPRTAASVLLAFGVLCLPAYSASAQTLSAPVAAEKCAEEGDLLPNPDDAGSFFHCSHGVAYLKKCPSILHFNPVLKVCDWPERAGNPAADQGTGSDPS
ncbi:carbohydrate-binding module family 14 protein [Streptomyces albovinaceus]|uniref:carbohydrate-binding module family 14 protein n=1 Tax=Streptomyces albovinaceus TaxID=66867 RepID=UPI001302E889|nr:carbohydrate-binding module family 14 protein [Streptomyces albovinaceus]